MKREFKVRRDKFGIAVHPITVPEPYDYSVQLEAARGLLRRKGRTASIDPPPRTVMPAAGFQVM